MAEKKLEGNTLISSSQNKCSEKNKKKLVESRACCNIKFVSPVDFKTFLLLRMVLL